MYMNMSYQYLFVCVPLDKGNDPLRYIFDQLLNKASNTITNENHIGKQIDIFCFFREYRSILSMMIALYNKDLNYFSDLKQFILHVLIR